MNLDRDLVRTALPNYDIEGEIGRGGWGTVLAGRHRTLGRRVAIKQLPRAYASDPVVRERFVAEARTVSALDHPHIVPVYDFIDQDGMHLIVMELLEGGTLWDQFRDRGVRPDVACAVTMGIASALHAAHRHGILHRDLKPENVLFNAAGVPKLADFGVAKELGGDRHLTMAGEVLGTPAYMSPEQVTGKPLGPQSDVYSLAVVLFELLAGQPPFAEEDPIALLTLHAGGQPRDLRDLAPVPSPLADTVMAALAKSPDDRPPSAEAFGAAVARGAAHAFGPTWLADSAVPYLGGGPIGTAALEAPRAPARETLAPTAMRRAQTTRHRHLGSVGPAEPNPSDAGMAALPQTPGAVPPAATMPPATASPVGAPPADALAPTAPIAAPPTVAPSLSIPPADLAPTVAAAPLAAAAAAGAATPISSTPPQPPGPPTPLPAATSSPAPSEPGRPGGSARSRWPWLVGVALLAVLVVGGLLVRNNRSARDDRVGKIDGKVVLADRAGRTLYVFARDEVGKSNCNDPCSSTWPPVEPGSVIVGIPARRLSTIERLDGRKQLAVDGRPLYRYVNDHKAGDVTGHNVSGAWFALSEDGQSLTTLVRLGSTDSGTVLVDGQGFVLYTFDRDPTGISDCNTPCSNTWPPVPGSSGVDPGLDEKRFTRITRIDGSSQLAFDGKPLYHYVDDKNPGDANGTSVSGGVWKVVPAAAFAANRAQTTTTRKGS